MDELPEGLRSSILYATWTTKELHTAIARCKDEGWYDLIEIYNAVLRDRGEEEIR